MDVYGDLNVYGTKNFVQPHPTDTTKLIKYVAIESGEALALARGLSKTINGVGRITLPEHFALVTSDTEPLTVIITPENAQATLYVKEKSDSEVVIGMKSTDFMEFGDVSFAFQVTGVRDGFENQEVIVDVDVDVDKVNSQDNISEKRATYNEKVDKMFKKQTNAKKSRK